MEVARVSFSSTATVICNVIVGEWIILEQATVQLIVTVTRNYYCDSHQTQQRTVEAKRQPDAERNKVQLD